MADLEQAKLTDEEIWNVCEAQTQRVVIDKKQCRAVAQFAQFKILKWLAAQPVEGLELKRIDDSTLFNLPTNEDGEPLGVTRELDWTWAIPLEAQLATDKLVLDKAKAMIVALKAQIPSQENLPARGEKLPLVSDTNHQAYSQAGVNYGWEGIEIVQRDADQIPFNIVVAERDELQAQLEQAKREVERQQAEKIKELEADVKVGDEGLTEAWMLGATEWRHKYQELKKLIKDTMLTEEEYKTLVFYYDIAPDKCKCAKCKATRGIRAKLREQSEAQSKEGTK